MLSAVEYVESLSPWPKDGFGLDRIKALLRALGDPQLRYPSIHVVGTNGKSTVTRTIEALLGREGLVDGAYLSPHVTSWYKNEFGRVSQNWPFGLIDYWRATLAPNPDDFVLERQAEPVA